MTFVEDNARMTTVVRFAAFLAVALAILSPARVSAAARPNGYPITNVNLRAGPGTDYPVIVTVPTHAPISIRGCLGDYTWCDVIFEGDRGWMRSIYLKGWYQGYYYSLRDYAPRLGYPVVVFNIGPYWDNYYRDRPFYAERARWGARYGEGWVDRANFYRPLEPYGNWIWLQGQYVWVPGNVGSTWRPYTQGRWVFTDRYGWTWVSDEPFGWATYHYGRWGFSNRVGWFWVPGSRWAPAWVSWRSSPNYLAWAPLPPTADEGLSINISVGNVPDYYWAVVPNRDFLAPNLPRYIVHDRHRYNPILADTRPLGNVTVVNNTVVNKVVNVNYVEQKTNRKVSVYKIDKVKDKDKSKRSRIKGDAIEIFEPAPETKPELAAPMETKPIEEVAAKSKTRQQGKGEAATDELLVPEDVKKPLEAEAKAPPPPPPAKTATPASESDEAAPPPPPPPAEEAAPEPKKRGKQKTDGEGPPPSPVDESAPPPPPAEEVAPEPKNHGKPRTEKEAKPEESGPPPSGPSTEETAPPPRQPEEIAPESNKPGKPKKDHGPAPKESGPTALPPPPPPTEQAAPPPPPPPAEPVTPELNKPGKPKRDHKAGPKESGPPPSAPPPPTAKDVAPPPPPPSDEPAPKANKQGKHGKDHGGPPPPPAGAMDNGPASQPSTSGNDGQRNKGGKKGKKGAPCPDGDDTCGPEQ